MLLLISKSFLYHFSSLNFEQYLVTGQEKRKPAVLMLSVLKKFPGVGFQRIFVIVILQKILLLMIPKLALFDFFPGRTHYFVFNSHTTSETVMFNTASRISYREVGNWDSPQKEGPGRGGDVALIIISTLC